MQITYFTALFPYILLSVLLYVSLNLPGAGDGLNYYLNPVFDKFGSFQVWLF